MVAKKLGVKDNRALTDSHKQQFYVMQWGLFMWGKIHSWLEYTSFFDLNNTLLTPKSTDKTPETGRVKGWYDWVGLKHVNKDEANVCFSFYTQEQPTGSTFEVEWEKAVANNKQRAHCLNLAADMQSSRAFTECRTCSHEQWSHWSIHVNCAWGWYIFLKSSFQPYINVRCHNISIHLFECPCRGLSLKEDLNLDQSFSTVELSKKPKVSW